MGEIVALERSFNSMAGSLEDGRDQPGRLADEQAALRRVATLVARGVPAVEVFATVAEEVGRLLGTDGAGIVRYEANNTTHVPGPNAAVVPQLGIRSAVSCPIGVEGGCGGT